VWVVSTWRVVLHSRCFLNLQSCYLSAKTIPGSKIMVVVYTQTESHPSLFTVLCKRPKNEEITKKHEHCCCIHLEIILHLVCFLNHFNSATWYKEATNFKDDEFGNLNYLWSRSRENSALVKNWNWIWWCGWQIVSPACDLACQRQGASTVQPVNSLPRPAFLDGAEEHDSGDDPTSPVVSCIGQVQYNSSLAHSHMLDRCHWNFLS